ncbi:MAG: C45 family autoproteolytic acyltransferase/hydrolase [Alphaproteobacteria bacterium]
MREIEGIADGFGLGAADVFDYLHASILADPRAPADDGCTVIAATLPGGGAVVAKNRDYRAEHVAIQRVFHHVDPAWGGREMLCVGSLGSPGNFSSGINSDGLAVADTHVSTTDHGTGMHRFFLLTWLLAHAATVEAALAAIRSMPHAGGGVLALGDAAGAVAAVELGHRASEIEHAAAGRIGRTNHFVGAATAGPCADAGDGDGRANSIARLDHLRRALDADPPATADASAAILSRHAAAGAPALCRHGGDDLSSTISSHVYDTRTRTLVYSGAQPCHGVWQRHGFGARAGASPGDPS